MQYGLNASRQNRWKLKRDQNASQRNNSFWGRIVSTTIGLQVPQRAKATKRWGGSQSLKRKLRPKCWHKKPTSRTYNRAKTLLELKLLAKPRRLVRPIILLKKLWFKTWLRARGLHLKIKHLNKHQGSQSLRDLSQKHQKILTNNMAEPFLSQHKII